MPAPYQGGCQCGAVRYEIGDEPTGLNVCHCTDCQRQSGSAFSMSLRVPAASLRFISGTVKTFQMAGESGKPKDCAFCPQCGTRLYHALPGSPWVMVKPGTLDDPSHFKPVAHIWTRSKQPWIRIPDGMLAFEKGPLDPAVVDRAWAERDSTK
jgi:hypothetical protein